MKILAIGLLLTANVQAMGYMGYAYGTHLMGEKLNNSHPYVGVEDDNVGVIAYQNSFDKLGVAPYYNFQTGKEIVYSFRLGLTTGYRQKMEYKGVRYSLMGNMFIGSELMIFAVPMISWMNENDSSIDLSLLGDSVNLGFTIRF